MAANSKVQGHCLYCNWVMAKNAVTSEMLETIKVIVCLFVCLLFNGTFSTNRLYRAIEVGSIFT